MELVIPRLVSMISVDDSAYLSEWCEFSIIIL